MNFTYEHQMLGPAQRWLRTKGLMTKTEFSTPWGICDIVGCSFNHRNVKKRIGYGQINPIGPHVRVMLLSPIPDHTTTKSITLAELCRQFAPFFDQPCITLELNRLIKDKFVRVTPQGAFQKINGWMPLRKKIVALELKLNRVTEVLYQAINHLEFADESYVGLPIEIAERVAKSPRRSEFLYNGIGILGITSDKCKVLLKSAPSLSWQNPIFQAHCAERFWRTYIKDS